MKWIGALVGVLYGSLGFGLGILFSFCTAIQTVFCQATRPLVVFLPATLLGGPMLIWLSKVVPFAVALTVAVFINSVLWGLFGYWIDLTVRSLLKRPVSKPGSKASSKRVKKSGRKKSKRK